MSDGVKRTAESQGSIIPQGWKPTVAEPVPVVRCTQIKKDGTRCGRWSLRGCEKCLKHGGQLPNVQAHAQAVVEAARLRILDLADEAIDVIHDLALNSTADQVRLGAANSLLDRANIKGPIEVEVQVSHGESATDRARQRLADIADRITVQATPVEDSSDADVVDAEVVEPEA